MFSLPDKEEKGMLSFLVLPDWFIDLLKRETPTVAIVFVLLICLGCYIQRQHKSHLRSKDCEIERLVKEKNKLQNLLLKNRLSTDEGKRDEGDSHE